MYVQSSSLQRVEQELAESAHERVSVQEERQVLIWTSSSRLQCQL
jgi:hypothetical protein